MYQNCCKKCGSIALHTEMKGNNTGLYCEDCGAWIKWLGKDELRAFENAKSQPVMTDKERINEAIKLAVEYGGIDGVHHKDWVIDQMVRVLTGEEYEQIVKDAWNTDEKMEVY